jgi:hypothetical protein
VGGWAKTVTLSWDASPSDVNGYYIYYVAGSAADLSSASDPTMVVVGDVLTYTLSDLENGVDHSFAIKAYDTSGNQSIYSNIVTSAALDVGEVDSTTEGDGETKNVTLSWDASPSDIYGYNIYYVAGSAADLTAASNPAMIDVGNVLSYSLTGLDGAQAHSFAVTAYDNTGNESIYSNIVVSASLATDEPTNSPPVLASIGNRSVAEGSTLTFIVTATDADDDSLSYSVSSLPSGAVFASQSGLFRWTPGYTQSSNYPVIFTVSDGSESDTETISITVANTNRAPVLDAIGAQTGAEGAALNFTLTATDADSDSLNYSASSLPSGAIFSAQNGTFSWTPSYAQSGSYSVVFAVSDGSESDTETTPITVANTNRAPVLDAIGAQTGAEGAALSFTLTATDADNDSLSYSASELPSGANFSTQSGAFNWTPTVMQAGSYSISFGVSDGSVADYETATILISNVNQAPVLATIGTKTVNEGSALSFTISASDADNDAVTYSASDLPDGATFDATLRQFNWTPSYDSSANNRVFTVTFSASDGLASDAETVTLSVLNANRAPVITSIAAQSLTGGLEYDLDIVATDADGDTLTYSASGLPEGSIFVPLTRTFSWIPSDEQRGMHNVTFTVSDGDISVSETVAMTVALGNEAPVLQAIGTQSVDEGSQLTIVLMATDANEDLLTYAVTGLPAGATFDAATQVLNWTPDFTQAGTFSLVCSVSDGELTDSETVEVVVSNSNQGPTISGTPGTSIMATTDYLFTPTADDSDGDSLIFSIANKPGWATFDTASGALSGTPGEGDIGSTANILISVSDGSVSTSLEPFSVAVALFEYVDSDGDGITDDQDAFPDDPDEWLDSDGDLIGNNDDDDDDNDGIADIRDGAPLDASDSGWILSAIAGEGGYISPDGDTAVLFGGSQRYVVTSLDGYYLSELLIDGVSAELVHEYTFESISQHHSIEVAFTEIPDGLSCDAAESGLIGIERVDGGTDADNYVDEKPKHDLDFRFTVKLKEDVAEVERVVYLVLDNYKYSMQRSSGALLDGADYSYTTRLGPAAEHRFYYLAEDVSGQELWRYPQSDTLPGPVIDLLNGSNLVGMSADVDAYDLTSDEALGTSRAYRWLSESRRYQRVDSGVPITTGEGYIIRSETSQLPDLSGYGQADTDYSMVLNYGWNLISNPYGGNVNLADVLVATDDALVDWLTAVDQNLVIDMVYSYLGSDWGGGHEFASADGSESAVLVPWIGYWIYVNSADQTLTLVIEKPLQ